MNINKVKIAGFSNIDNVELNLKKINSLIALNNYGKSNVIKGLDFGIDFINNSPKTRDKMMSFKPYIPYNKHIDNRAFEFEVELNTEINNEKFEIIYSYAFDWIKNDKEKGQRIISELLKIKNVAKETKFKTYIKRDITKANFLPSETARCNKDIKVDRNELVINKLQNYDDLFYLQIVDVLNEIDIASVDTLQNPDDLFKKIRIGDKENQIVKNDYSLSMSDARNSAFFIYSLMQKDVQMYELYKDAVLTLLPSLMDFEPIEVDLKEQFSFNDEERKLPLDFPEKIYDIRIKENNNNQQTSITSLSSGSQKIFYVISIAIAAEINKVPLLTYEELENSIHPGLLQKLLIILDNLLEYTKIVLSSHSPYLIQYLNFENIKIGVPNEKGLACFRELKKTKFKKLLSLADDENISVGDLIFEKMIENVDLDESFFNEMCS